MATTTRTFTITADDTVFSALDAAMALVINLDPTGETTPIPSSDYTLGCIKDWLVQIAQRSAAKQTDMAVAAAQANAQVAAEEAVALVNSLQMTVG